MLAMIHGNRTRVENGMFRVDRKFHSGMSMYVKNIGVPIVSIHPESEPGEVTMDLIEVPCDELGYQVITAKVDNRRRLVKGELEKLYPKLKECKLLYGHGLEIAELAKRLSIPFILVLEYDLSTHLTIARSAAPSFLRGISRSVKEIFRYVGELPDFMNAASLHCNGYPIFEATTRYNKRRLLYLDSRMGTDMVIKEEQLEARLESLASGRTIRMLFSGRYEEAKGVLDVVRVALACLERGEDVELHCYGQGSLRDEMCTLANANPRIFIHDAIPYPELVEISRTFDLFICCHIQCDPSCTYLESFGAGLPIAGYDNLMWSGLRNASHAGVGVPISNAKLLSQEVQSLVRNPVRLASLSRAARSFAASHAFEHEYQRRTDEINAFVQPA